MSIPTVQRPTAPWQQPGHFQPGDSIVILGSTGRSALACTVVSEGTVLVRDALHQDPVRVEPWPQRVRHDSGCAPCMAYSNGMLLLGDLEAAEFRSQWSPAAHARFQQLECAIDWPEDPQARVCTRAAGSFTDHADVPVWLRETTAERLQVPEAGDFQLARVWADIDWPSLLERHPGELGVVIGKDGYGPAELTWANVVAAYRAVRDAGLTPTLDVDLFVDFDSSLILMPTILYCRCDDEQLREQVDSLLVPGITYQDDWPGWAWLA